MSDLGVVSMGGRDDMDDVEVEDSGSEEVEDLGFPTVDHKDTAFFGTGSDEEDEDQPKKKKKTTQGGFESFGFSYPVYKGIKHKGYRVPTPIQRKTIPLVLQGKDVVAMARTGSGKTAAFLLPLLERLKEHSTKVGVRGVVLSPTRELAMQSMKFFKELGKHTNLRGCLLVGGDSMEDQFDFLSQNPDVLVATPGRLIHHLVETKMSLKTVEYVVFDEADRLFEMGFQDQCQDILNEMTENRQTLLFSATLPKSLVEFTRAGLKDPELVRLDTDTKISENLRMAFFVVRSQEKMGAFLYLVDRLVKNDEMTIVFAATRHHVEFLHTVLEKNNVSATFIYGSMDQSARKINLAKFRAKKTPVMIVTDVAARGIDVPHLDNVINYDFPTKPKLFVHRVGRAARAGRSGTAYSLVEQTTESPYMVDLMLFLGRPLLSKRKPDADTEIGPIDEDPSVYYGTLPQGDLDVHLETYRTIHEGFPDVKAQHKVAMNAYKLYYKTRASASPSSCKRAKELEFDSVHPWLMANLNDDEIEKNEFVKHLQTFRPNATVFEVRELGGGKKVGEEVMRQKRMMHSKTIEAKSKKRSRKDETGPGDENHENDDDAGEDDEELEGEEHSDEDESSDGGLGMDEDSTKKRKRKDNGGSGGRKKTRSTRRDPNFYLAYKTGGEDYTERGLSLRDPNSQRIEDAILDLNPEDDSGMMKKRTAMKWDMKKKKYIQVNLGVQKESLSAKLKHKNEAGAAIKSDKNKKKNEKSIYEEWMKRSKNRIQQQGEDEDNRYGGKAAMGYGGFRHKNKEKIPNAHVRNELKHPDQVRKERKKKEDQKVKQMSKKDRRAYLQKEGIIGKNKDNPKAGAMGKARHIPGGRGGKGGRGRGGGKGRR